jgi:hypothetical protein
VVTLEADERALASRELDARSGETSEIVFELE